MNDWSYAPYSATLKRNGKFFAIVTPDTLEALSPEDERILLDALCQTKLENLQSAVREHATEMDTIMKGPSTYERGQKIAASLGKLEQALRLDSKSASAASGVTPSATASRAAPGNASFPAAASTPPRRKRKTRSSNS